MFGLSFLYPVFLFGALAAAVPIILHLLKRDVAPRVPFSDVRLLRRAPTEQRRRKWLRELILLALRVGALMLLALAFARPYSGAADAGRPIVMVALDTSFSMSAPAQFDRARALAREAIGEAGSAPVGLLAFDDAARVIVEPTTDRRRLEEAMAALEPTAGATRYGPAISRAAETLAGRAGRIIVVTDLQRAGWSSGSRTTVPAGVDVDVRDIGPAPANLAVTAVERKADTVMAVVLNTGQAARSTRAALRVDGQPMAETELSARPGSTNVVFKAPLPDVGAASVIIDDQIGYQADNVRYLLLDPAPAARLLLVTSAGIERSAFYLERALLVAEEAAPFEIEGASPASLSDAPPATLSEYDSVLLLGTQGLDRRGKETLAAYVRGGGGLLLAAGPQLDPAIATGLLGEVPAVVLSTASPVDRVRSLEPADLRHPVFRAFGALVGSLGQVRFHRVVAIEETPGARVIGRFHDGTPALVEYTAGRGTVLAFASDLNNEWNDFPRRPTFVPFVHETLRYLGGARERPREFVVGTGPPGLPREAGVTRLQPTGRRVAVNVDPLESDPSRLSVEAFQAALERKLEDTPGGAGQSTAVEQESAQNYWWYVLLAVTLLLAGESWIGRRAA